VIRKSIFSLSYGFLGAGKKIKNLSMTVFGIYQQESPQLREGDIKPDAVS
jgi:hypothetical protein